MNKKRLTINMIANLISFLVSMGISFFLSPYIINTVGKEAYGFVGLANNFVTYGELVTLALNSMAGRFITIKIHQGDKESANKYFSSITFANIIITIIMLIPATFIIFNLNHIVNVPQDILSDVRLLWTLTFVNFFVSLLTSTYGLATYVTNRLDLSSIRDIQANVIRAILIITLFYFFKPSVWFIALVSLICTVIVGIYNIIYKKKLLADVKVSFSFFDIRLIKEVLVSGSWNVVTKLGQILSDGLDLLIANIFIDSASMGILSIAKTIPMAVSRLVGMISNVFSPQLTIDYAKDNNEQLVEGLKKGMVISGFFTNIALGFTIAFGYMFYSLWVPNEDTDLIQIASVLTVLGVFIPGVINNLWSVFTITNRLKLNSIIIVANGLLNTLLVFILLKTTDLGILAIAGVSTITSTIRNLTYTPMYAAHCLNISKKTFYPVILRYILSSSVIIVVYSLLVKFTFQSSWLILFINGIFCGLIGVVINYLLLLDKAEKLQVRAVLKKIRLIKVRNDKSSATSL